ncbi:hypothetical protein BDN72DRAFT_854868 [Pluteus cervinus]|uniref:Uncharacterized protein n=1 Tax=Pluteus cervinus TaxID=181527 RepID=A0ACD3B5U9_9AGAR|nr:hypothetical protein BDN72DRAFT_854868 [Pluteus cervinus]
MFNGGGLDLRICVSDVDKHEKIGWGYSSEDCLFIDLRRLRGTDECFVTTSPAILQWVYALKICVISPLEVRPVIREAKRLGCVRSGDERSLLVLDSKIRELLHLVAPAASPSQNRCSWSSLAIVVITPVVWLTLQKIRLAHKYVFSTWQIEPEASGQERNIQRETLRSTPNETGLKDGYSRTSMRTTKPCLIVGHRKAGEVRLSDGMFSSASDPSEGGYHLWVVVGRFNTKVEYSDRPCGKDDGGIEDGVTITSLD